MAAGVSSVWVFICTTTHLLHRSLVLHLLVEYYDTRQTSSSTRLCFNKGHTVQRRAPLDQTWNSSASCPCISRIKMAASATDDRPVTQSAVLLVWQFLKAHPFLIIFVLLFVRPLYNRYSSPLRQFPGPFLASCTRLWKGMCLGQYFVNSYG